MCRFPSFFTHTVVLLSAPRAIPAEIRVTESERGDSRSFDHKTPVSPVPALSRLKREQ